MNKMLKIKKKGNEGITLIALVITIIVLIIIAGITINLLMGDNGILTRAKGAKEEFNKSKMLEDTTILLMDYSAEREITGITLEEYLTKNNISYEKDGTNIKFIEEGFELTVNPITLEIDGPVKANKATKIVLSSNIIEPEDTLTITLTLGEDVNLTKCKYKFEKADIEVKKDDVTTAVSGTTITIPSSETAQKGEYYFYLLVAYKDSEETELKKVKVKIDVDVTGLTLNQMSLNLNVGSTTTLIASVLPSKAEQRVIWSTNNSNIATVNSKGVVTAVGEGTAIITATSIINNNITAKCDITTQALFITYKPNGGSGSMNPTPIISENTKIEKNKFEAQNGYIFSGWNTAADGSGTSYIAGNTYHIESNIDLYAQWENFEEYISNKNAENLTYVSAENPYYTYEAKAGTKYFIEMYGAQGGSYNAESHGGYGGHSYGIYIPDEDTTLYIYIGGAGEGKIVGNAKSGGYNGGGDMISWHDGNEKRSTGGGATHIATSNGLLKDLVDNKESIIMVAGGRRRRRS